jgi:hypothetical protein
VRSEELIGSLSTGLKPVRRMVSPQMQALLWLGLATLVVGAAVAINGMRHDMMGRLEIMHEVGQLAASLATGISAAMAAAMLARPDRSSAWALLPLPAVAAWFATLGYGCMADMDRMGPAAMTLSTSWGCTRFIIGIGLPLAAVMFWLLRHAGPVRPRPVLLMGGLASAAICSFGLSLFHHLDAALMVLVWHGSAALVLLLLGLLAGPRVMARLPGR